MVRSCCRRGALVLLTQSLLRLRPHLVLLSDFENRIPQCLHDRIDWFLRRWAALQGAEPKQLVQHLGLEILLAADCEAARGQGSGFLAS